MFNASRTSQFSIPLLQLQPSGDNVGVVENDNQLSPLEEEALHGLLALQSEPDADQAPARQAQLPQQYPLSAPVDHKRAASDDLFEASPRPLKRVATQRSLTASLSTDFRGSPEQKYAAQLSDRLRHMPSESSRQLMASYCQLLDPSAAIRMFELDAADLLASPEKRTAFPLRPDYATMAAHHVAALLNMPSWLNESVRRGANVNDYDVALGAKTPLMLAAEYGHADIVSALLRVQACVDAKDQLGRTPLSYAAGGGHAEIIGQLLIHQARVDDPDHGGFTPLMYAAAGGHLSAVDALLINGADPHSYDNYNLTAIYYANKLGSRAVVNRIQNAIDSLPARSAPPQLSTAVSSRDMPINRTRIVDFKEFICHLNIEEQLFALINKPSALSLDDLCTQLNAPCEKSQTLLTSNACPYVLHGLLVYNELLSCVKIALGAYEQPGNRLTLEKKERLSSIVNADYDGHTVRSLLADSTTDDDIMRTQRAELLALIERLIGEPILLSINPANQPANDATRATELLSCYTEQQQGLSCGRHAINTLFQAPVVTDSALLSVYKSMIELHELDRVNVIETIPAFDGFMRNIDSTLSEQQRTQLRIAYADRAWDKVFPLIQEGAANESVARGCVDFIGGFSVSNVVRALNSLTASLHHLAVQGTEWGPYWSALPKRFGVYIPDSRQADPHALSGNKELDRMIHFLDWQFKESDGGVAQHLIIADGRHYVTLIRNEADWLVLDSIQHEQEIVGSGVDLLHLLEEKGLAEMDGQSRGLILDAALIDQFKISRALS